MVDGSTFAIHGSTRTFWVKPHAAGTDMMKIDRAQVISCIPPRVASKSASKIR